MYPRFYICQSPREYVQRCELLVSVFEQILTDLYIPHLLSYKFYRELQKVVREWSRCQRSKEWTSIVILLAKVRTWIPSRKIQGSKVTQRFLVLKLLSFRAANMYSIPEGFVFLYQSSKAHPCVWYFSVKSHIAIYQAQSHDFRQSLSYVYKEETSKSFWIFLTKTFWSIL